MLIVGAGSVVVTGLVIWLLLLSQLAGTESSHAATGSAANNGNWSSASTWSFNRVPQDYDTLTIPVGKTVIVDVVTQQYRNMVINVMGTLHFDGGKKIRMCDGKVVLSSTGVLIGDNNGSKLDICDNIVWTGGTNLTGPLTLVGSGPLPIELLYFKAASANNGVINFNWATATETNNDYFTVEKSANGAAFEKILDKKGAGNSNTVNHYNASVSLTGYDYFRLKQTDYDGQFTYSDVVMLKKAKSEAIQSFSSFPNPFKDNLTVSFSCVNACTAELQLFNSNMQLLRSEKVQTMPGYNEFPLSDVSLLPAGNYIVMMVSDNQKLSQKILKH